MKTFIQTTSLQAYSSIKNELVGKRKKVLEQLYYMTSASNTELAEALDWPINCVTPRVKELRERYLVRELCKRKCSVTNQTVIEWIPTTEEEFERAKQGQGDLFVKEEI